MSKRGITILVAALCLVSAACSKETEQTRSTLSQREKDSILAGSQIPGARAVKKTMTTADSAAARQARIDSAQQNP
ncbi:MAG TPA: hypothetical protein VEK37_04515 [Gemmatimonadaceae bacterium]|nr:hypothetical protein [Gemmatimonadaceae bacterium]